MSIQWKIATTDQELEACFQLRSLEYERRYKSNSGQVYSDHFDFAKLTDGSPRSFVIAVEYENQVVGTGRVVIISQDGQHYFDNETQTLLNLHPNVLDYIRQETEITQPRFVEVGKLAISDVSRDLKVKILSTVIHACGDVAHDRGFAIWIGVMQQSLAQLTLDLGIDFKQSFQATPNRTEDSLRIMLQFHEYFFPELASTHPEILSLDYIQNAPYETLKSMTALEMQQFHLYWGYTHPQKRLIDKAEL